MANCTFGLTPIALQPRIGKIPKFFPHWPVGDSFPNTLAA